MSSPTGTPTASPSALVEVEPESETRDHVQAVYLAIFVCVLALVLGLLAAHGLRRLRVHFLSEASVLLVVGVLVGALIHLDSGERVVHGVEQITLFDGEVLFILLLPPIIFDSGFRSSLDSFFNNIGGICVLAFAGTFSATAMTGLLVYGGGQLEWIYQTSAVEALSFGSLVSATDPVTILSTLHSLGVDPTLYSLVFGESVLNDAVAIASFNTVVNFEEEPVSVMLVLRGIGKFLEIFLGSFGIGVLVGCLSAVLLQRGVLLNVESNIVNHSHLVRSDHSHSRSGGQRSRHWGSKTNDAANGTRSIDSDSETEINMHHDNDDSDDIIVNEIDADADSDSGNDNSNVTSTTVDDDDVVHVDAESPARVQVTVLALMPYLSYCLAEYLRLSGIVSILFCGFTMSKYAKLYMGKESANILGETFQTLAHVAESFIFIYLGMAVFMSEDEVWNEFGFAIYALVAVLIARLVTVVPLMMLYNLCRSRDNKLGFRKIFVLWLSGLRGAIAFALAAQSPYRLKNAFTGRVFKTATMFIAYVTVVLIGGVMPWVTMRLGLATEDGKPGKSPRRRLRHGNSSQTTPLFFDSHGLDVSHHDDDDNVVVELTSLHRDDITTLNITGTSEGHVGGTQGQQEEHQLGERVEPTYKAEEDIQLDDILLGNIDADYNNSSSNHNVSATYAQSNPFAPAAATGGGGVVTHHSNPFAPDETATPAANAQASTNPFAAQPY